MFKKLYEELVAKDKVDVIVRHGDQVYADEAFSAGMKFFHDNALSLQDKKEKSIEAYKEIYRQVWTHEFTRDVLANCSTLMIWDDHEIRNDWGTLAIDKDKNSIEWQVATCARVDWHYQRQLWDDITGKDVNFQQVFQKGTCTLGDPLVFL